MELLRGIFSRNPFIRKKDAPPFITPATPEISSELNAPLPLHFGIWQTVPEKPEVLTCTLSDKKGFSYTFSFQHNPESQVITCFELGVAAGPQAKAGEKPALPPGCVTNITSQFAQPLTLRLFEQATVKDPLPALLGLTRSLWFDTPLSAFNPNEELMKLRIEADPDSAILAIFKQAQKISAGVALTALEQISKKPPANQLVPLETLLQHASKVESSPELPFAAQVLTQACRGLPPQGFVKLFFKSNRKFPRDYSISVTEEILDTLIPSIFVIEPPAESLKFLEQLMNIKREFSIELQRRTCTLVGSSLISRNQIDILAKMVEPSSSNYHAGMDVFGDFAAQRNHSSGPPLWSKEAARALYPNHLGVVLRCASSFEDIDIDEVVEKALELPHGATELAKSLPSLSGIKGSVGVFLAEKLYEDKVLRHISSFNWNADDIRAFIQATEQTNQIFGLVQHLGKLPERFIEAAETSWHLATYKKDFGIADIPLYFEFLELKRARNETGLAALLGEIRHIRDLAITGSEIPQSCSTHRYFRPIIESLFHNNSSRTTSYESNDTCSDRTTDLARLKIRSVYPIRLTQAAEMILRPAAKEDARALSHAEAPLKAAQEQLAPSDWNVKEMQKLLEKRLNQLGPIVERFSSLHEKLFGAFVQSSLGKIERKVLKELVTQYQLTTHPPMKQHIAQTRMEAESAKHPRYAYLMSLHEYYKDMMYDCLRALCGMVSENKEVITFLQKQYPALREFHEAKRRRAVSHRLQAPKLASPALYARLSHTLMNKEGGGKTREERLKIVSEIIGTEQRRIAQFIQEITGVSLPESDIHLADFSLPTVLSTPLSHLEAPSKEFLLNYAGNELEHLFDEELKVIEQEIKKYQPSSEEEGKGGIRLNAYISKNKAAAHARMVGGVCVSRDNPLQAPGNNPHGIGEDNEDFDGPLFLPHHLPAERKLDPDLCMWNLPNFYQLVLHDSITGRCEGLVMLHEYLEKGERLLTASFNPTSSILFKVKEDELFKALLKAVAAFAAENDFCYVCTARDRGIRTNRTGGGFEGALDAQIRAVNKQIILSKKEVFSFRPNYVQQVLDVVWINTEKNGPSQDSA